MKNQVKQSTSTDKGAEVEKKKPEIRENKEVILTVIGVGGSGKNMTNHMIKSDIQGINFIAANTDSQDLKQSKAGKKISLGKTITKGLGTGMSSTVGKAAAEESLVEIKEALKDSDMVFIACGMGGGTGTGAAPIIAKIAKEMGIITVAVITKPFSFEGQKRAAIAEEGLREIKKFVDASIVIPNDNILKNNNPKASLSEAFALSDDVLLQSVGGISDLINTPGDINVDFSDIKATIRNSGSVVMGVGIGRGTNRVEDALKHAIASQLLDTSIKGAQKILFSIASTSKKDILMTEVQTIAERITEHADPNAQIIFGTSTDKNLKQGEIRVTVIATSFNENYIPVTKTVAQEEYEDEEGEDATEDEDTTDDMVEDDADGVFTPAEEIFTTVETTSVRKNTPEDIRDDANLFTASGVRFAADEPKKNEKGWNLKDLWKEN